MFDNEDQMKQIEDQRKRFRPYPQEAAPQAGLPSIEEDIAAHPGNGLREMAMPEAESNFPGGLPREEAELWPGGPLISQIEAWKKLHGFAAYTEIGEEMFVWRRLTRWEYKAIVAQPNTTPLQREEMICEVCVLWPAPYDYKEQVKQPAGIAGTLAKTIMQASGFINNPVTKIL